MNKVLEEIESKKDWLDCIDIMRLLDCGEAVARRIIREIRYYCGFTLLPRGKVFISEYKAYVNKGAQNA